MYIRTYSLAIDCAAYVDTLCASVCFCVNVCVCFCVLLLFRVCAEEAAVTAELMVRTQTIMIFNE